MYSHLTSILQEDELFRWLPDDNVESWGTLLPFVDSIDSVL